MDFEQLSEHVAMALGDSGWCIVDDAFSPELVNGLARECQASGDFRVAGTGRRDAYQRDASVRSDAIRWLERSNEADAAYLAVMQELRSALNSRLYLGLFDYECHYARYVPGAFYRKHLDAFAGARNRVLSTVLYLNEGWRKEEGGELLLYEDTGMPIERILPQFNRLVIFLSERFPHEVRPATRARHSIAGWFRVRS